jgi:hypothetical protein
LIRHVGAAAWEVGGDDVGEDDEAGGALVGD